MKYNYPVYYAAMPIKERVGWTNCLRDFGSDCGTVCYIVSKCYKLGERINNKEDGREEKKYEVFFPYQKGELKGNLYDWQRLTPILNYADEYINSEFVEQIHNSYEAALEEATEKNQKLYNKVYTYAISRKDYDKAVDEETEKFNARLSRYKMLEEQILSNVPDLDNSKVKELNDLVIIKKGEVRVLYMNLYKYLSHTPYTKRIMLSISLEQYNKLVEQIDKQDMSDISEIIKNASPILYHDKNGKPLVINSNGDVLYVFNAWDVLESNDDQKIPYVDLNTIDDEAEYVYTTETLEDIVLSYSEYKCIDPTEIQGPVLKQNFYYKK